MPKRVHDLIEKQQLESVPSSASVRDAVKLMFKNTYSQLPVIDGDGNLIGLFSEQVFTRVFYFDIAVGFLDSSVSEWMDRTPHTVRAGQSIYDIMPVLATTYAVVMTDHDKPIGIVTDYDIAAFLAEWSEGIALVEDIETRLRAFIERIFRTQSALDAALVLAFNKNRQRENKPFRTYDKLSLAEHMLLIETDGNPHSNWKLFEPYFRPKPTFHRILEPIDDIRNQIMHFRGKLTPSQLKTLRTAATWLESRPHVPEPAPTTETTETRAAKNLA